MPLPQFPSRRIQEFAKHGNNHLTVLPHWEMIVRRALAHEVGVVANVAAARQLAHSTTTIQCAEIDGLAHVVHSLEIFCLVLWIAAGERSMTISTMQVLLIDDNTGDVLQIDKTADEAAMSIEMVHVHELEEGIKRCSEMDFDVVLLAVKPAETDALDSLRVFRRRMPAIPVIILSSSDDVSVGIKLVQAGAQDFLVKGRIDADAFAHTLTFARERHRANEHQHKTEQALVKSEKQFRDLFENSPDAIVVVTWNSRVVDINPAGCKLLGKRRCDMIDKSLMHVAPRPHRAKMAESLQAPANKRGNSVEGTWWSASGEAIPVEIQSSAIDVQDDPCLLLHVRDLTERRLLEEELRQSQKLEAIGQLAGGVAHDFNNLLTVINGYCKLLMTEHKPDDFTLNIVKEISSAGGKAVRLTRQLLAFSSKQMLQPVPLQINQIVLEMKKLIGRLIGEHIQIHAEFAEPLPHIFADPGQMEQIIANLAVNSRDAMPNGGDFDLETHLIEFDEEAATKRPEITPGRYVELTVRDTGCGMKKETVDRIFEPFFTTKEVGKGTGLGLATVYGIVKQTKGYIYVTSEENKGTTFSLYFPAMSGNPEKGRPTSDKQDMPGGQEVLLLVEDDDSVRCLAQRILKQCGYTVLEASNGEHGVEVFDENAKRIDALITDLIMPKMGGREMANKLRLKNPKLRTIFLSGYTDDGILKAGIAGNEFPFLQKPFTPQSLAQKVREVLDG